MKLVSPAAYMRNRVRGVYYGWWLVALRGFVSWISTVPLNNALSVWMVALESHFGWNRTQLSLAYSFTRFQSGFLAPAEGYLTDRIGTRRMVLVGLLILGVGFLFFGQVRNLWMFYLAFLVMNLGHGVGGAIPLVTMLNHWFARRRATAMAWASVGGQLGALMLVPALAWAIDPDHDRLGWRLTASVLGIFILAIAFPVAKLIRDRPEDYNLRPDGDPPDSAPATPAPGGTPTTQRGHTTAVATDFTVAQALRTPAFWLITMGQSFVVVVVSAVFVHLGLLLKDEGFGLQTTGWVLAVFTAVAMVFQVVGGYVGDRMPKNVATFIFTSILAGAAVMLAVASSLAMFYLFAVLFGIGHGGRTPLNTAIWGEYFGRASFGKILGLSSTPMSILGLIAPSFAGLIRDTQGTYTPAFLVLAAVSFLGGVLFLMAKKPVLPASPRVLR